MGRRSGLPAAGSILRRGFFREVTTMALSIDLASPLLLTLVLLVAGDVEPATDLP
jgi:hypothetical protein